MEEKDQVTQSWVSDLGTALLFVAAVIEWSLEVLIIRYR